MMSLISNNDALLDQFLIPANAITTTLHLLSHRLMLT